MKYTVTLYDNGTYKTPVNAEVDMAIQEYLAYEYDEYLTWRKDHSYLFAEAL